MCTCNKNTENVVSSSSSVTNDNGGSKRGRKPKAKTVISGNTPAPKVEKRGVCSDMYDDLRMLDKKTYDLFKRTRLDRDSDGYQWLEIQRTLREWISKLSVECPDEKKLAPIREVIDQEYSKLF